MALLAIISHRGLEDESLTSFSGLSVCIHSTEPCQVDCVLGAVHTIMKIPMPLGSHTMAPSLLWLVARAGILIRPLPMPEPCHG